MLGLSIETVSYKRNSSTGRTFIVANANLLLVAIVVTRNNRTWVTMQQEKFSESMFPHNDFKLLTCPTLMRMASPKGMLLVCGTYSTDTYRKPHRKFQRIF